MIILKYAISKKVIALKGNNINKKLDEVPIIDNNLTLKSYNSLIGQFTLITLVNRTKSRLY